MLTSMESEGLPLPKPLSTISVTEALESVLRNPDRHAGMRRAARLRAVQRFNWGAIGQQIADEICSRV